ncbi:RNA polymerase sigma factor [Streptomyces sp. NPDC090106]|uniref:RNA polymerase sigma factor n=1 Tax=Streptomyces sp. NPDC090106 TaxID=3365946 RepID=UPI00382DA5BA
MPEPPGSTTESAQAAVPDVPEKPSPPLSGDGWRRLMRDLGAPRKKRTAEQDRGLFELLRQYEFRGPAYDIVMDNLAGAARRIMLAGIRNGSVFAECARIGRPVTDEGMIALLQEDAGEREEVVAELLAVCVPRFKRYALVDGGWKPNGGASLQTFLVGALVRELPNTFRKWARDHQRNKPGLTDPSRLSTFGRTPATDPVLHAVTADQIERALAGADPGIHVIAEMIRLGYPWAEIAQALGIGEKAAQQRWTRFTRKIGKIGKSDGNGNGNDESDEGGQR